ncbi:hypothetical protein GQX74_014841 [Glossina fuscipes]|nr:hypothetical protein GQX74_014841 [Glossina fuscipes]
MARTDPWLSFTQYSILMHVIFIMLWLLLQYLVYQREIFEDMANEFVDEAWAKMDSIHALQMEFNCCGVNDYGDYKESNQSVPLTCCGLNILKCDSNEYITAPGCRDAFTSYWATNTDIMISSGLVTSITRILAEDEVTPYDWGQWLCLL